MATDQRIKRSNQNSTTIAYEYVCKQFDQGNTTKKFK